jgi:shikimate dehydrogenase
MTVPTACVVGWPVKHSRSPLIHRFWLKQYGIVGDYVIQPVEPEKIEAFFAGFRDGPYVGCNVTVPHKEAAFAAADEIEPAGRAIGAVNTIWRDGNRLVATSTDGVGFLANLDERAPGWDRTPGPAVVLGAGGAARAVIWGLLERGYAPIHVVNRTAGRAEALAERFGRKVTASAWDALPRLLPNARVLVNSTSLGMEGQPSLAIDLAPLPADCLVTDIVYVPLETGLLAAAKTRGLPTVDGLGMLLHQAAPGFRRWFGRTPEVTPELRAAVLRDMGIG